LENGLERLLAFMNALDPDRLRRRAIDARRSARSVTNAELRRLFLEIAEGFDDLADAAQGIRSSSETPPATMPTPNSVGFLSD
jgi:hypothetical protein